MGCSCYSVAQHSMMHLTAPQTGLRHMATGCQNKQETSFFCFVQVGKDVISLITTREDVDNLLKLDDVIDLVIPRGSNALVTHIQQNTKIAVLGHADGICHIYLDPDCDIDMACKICIDSKTDYPAACNAVEKVLVHEALAKDGRVSLALLNVLLKAKLWNACMVMLS